jgi:lipid-binding SYLF domain-containing protein
MKTPLKYHASLALALFLTVAILPMAAEAQTDQEKLVTAAEKTFDNFVRDPDMKWLHENIANAKAVLIAPAIAKVGFILGGSGGRAVLLMRDVKTGNWTGPAFYSLATGSVGFQAGVEVSEMVTLVMTAKGVDSLLAGSFKLGGDASVAAGPVGAGAKQSVQSDLVAFSRSKGIYGGLNLDGTVVSRSEEWNKTYYKQTVSTRDILVTQNVKNPQADTLRKEVATAAGKK